MLIDVIKADITTATRMRNQLASDILLVKYVKSLGLIANGDVSKEVIKPLRNSA